jgi:peptidoglycan/LPS O-acetylase OafA/YrhL
MPRRHAGGCQRVRSMTTPRAAEWRYGIETLRGVAAISVMLFHCIGLLPVNVENSPLAIFKIGWVGVDVFFVISGYVVSRSAIRLSE